MSSNQTTVEFIVDQMSGANGVSARKMFGEYGVFCDGKMVALICDNQLFIKPTIGGGSFIGEVVEAPPYPGAKPCYLISGEQWDDGEWLSELVRITARELPLPKKKKGK
jgi:TfoX/Sxy family transcriptional regulator of competence genes